MNDLVVIAVCNLQHISLQIKRFGYRELVEGAVGM